MVSHDEKDFVEYEGRGEKRKILGREGMHLSLEDRFLFVVTQSFCHKNPMATI